MFPFQIGWGHICAHPSWNKLFSNSARFEYTHSQSCMQALKECLDLVKRRRLNVSCFRGASANFIIFFFSICLTIVQRFRESSKLQSNLVIKFWTFWYFRFLLSSSKMLISGIGKIWILFTTYEYIFWLSESLFRELNYFSHRKYC